jgi:hypothetical protein
MSSEIQVYPTERWDGEKWREVFHVDSVAEDSGALLLVTDDPAAAIARGEAEALAGGLPLHIDHSVRARLRLVESEGEA